MLAPLPGQIGQTGAIGRAVDADYLLQSHDQENGDRDTAQTGHPAESAQEEKPEDRQGHAEQDNRGRGPALEVRLHLGLCAERDYASDGEGPDGDGNPDAVPWRFGFAGFRFHELWVSRRRVVAGRKIDN